MTAFLKWQVGHFQPYNIMHVLPVLSIPLLPLLPQHRSQAFIQGVWTCNTALPSPLQISAWCPVKQSFGKHMYPIYLEKISQSPVTSAPLSSANCDVFKKAFKSHRTCPLISTGHQQLPSPSKALVVPPTPVFQPVLWHLLSGRQAVWENFPLQSPTGGFILGWAHSEESSAHLYK